MAVPTNIAMILLVGTQRAAPYAKAWCPVPVQFKVGRRRVATSLFRPLRPI